MYVEYTIYMQISARSLCGRCFATAACVYIRTNPVRIDLPAHTGRRRDVTRSSCSGAVICILNKTIILCGHARVRVRVCILLVPGGTRCA